jgi:hypothetical protein
MAAIAAGKKKKIIWLGAKGGTRTPTIISRQNLNLVRLPIPPLSRANHRKLAQLQDYQVYFRARYSPAIDPTPLLPRSSKLMIPLYESGPFYGCTTLQHKQRIPALP